MTKYYLILSLVFTFLFSSCTQLGFRKPNNTDEKPKHYIITMHGVRGNFESYGEFHQFVGSTLTEINPNYEYVPINWTYHVGKAVDESNQWEGMWTPHSIAKQFNEDMFLSANAKISHLNPQDKISILAYSMGGQMVLTWYYNTMFNFQFKPETNGSFVNWKYSQSVHQELLNNLKHVENIIGLGPVYWGSLDAELGWSLLGERDLTYIVDTINKVNNYCSQPSVVKLLDGFQLGRTYTQKLKDGIKAKFSEMAGFLKTESTVKKTENQKADNKDLFAKTSIAGACNAAKVVGDTLDLTSKLINGVEQILKNDIDTHLNQDLAEAIISAMKEYGNMHINEFNNMRPTSDLINELRILKIQQNENANLSQNFNTKWTSIVGVFPCLGKLDKGLTCSQFSSEGLKLANEQLVTIFSGLNRRETDGPVMSPGAVADFIYYTETQSKDSVTISDFKNTNDKLNNKEIYVENMHATVVPALTALSGALENIGKGAATELLDFDKMLGVDVVIMNKECKTPEKCEHPNYRHVIETISDCQKENAQCTEKAEKYLNEYFKVSSIDQRYLENEKLAQELGGYTMVLNLRVPKTYQVNQDNVSELINQIKFENLNNQGKSVRETQRTDTKNQGLIANQISRQEEILSRYATVKEYSDSKVIRMFFMGRAWAKNARNTVAGYNAVNRGVPVKFSVNFANLKQRKVEAKVKPGYSTYIDLILK